jgi:hypothetical protein
MSETTTTCTVHGLGCERLHVGHRVQVVYGEGQVGFGHVGVITADTASGDYTVRFDVPATVTVNAYDTGLPEVFVYPELTYREHELDKVAAV